MRSLVLWLIGLSLLSACTRPVAGRDGGEVVITELTVNPEFIRAGVPVQVIFRVAGPTPNAIRGDLGGRPLDCGGARRADGRFECTLNGVDPGTATQGPVDVEVTVVDDAGATSVAQTTATIDFDCPTVVSLSVDPEAATPEDQITVQIESSEPLGLAPRLSRAGRSWGVPNPLTPTRYELLYSVDDADPASEADLVVQLTDRAGNTTTDCGADGRRTVAIDRVAPTIDAQRFELVRGPPNTPAMLSAAAGAIRDDVRVTTINVYDGATNVLLDTFVPRSDGGLDAASLGASTSGRVLVEAVDLLERRSGRQTVAELWALSLGAGTSPNAALLTGVRLTPPSSDGQGFRDRTAELASSVVADDNQSATVEARMGFVPSGRLPNAYEDTIWIAGGYDAANDAIVMFGGAQFPNGSTDYLAQALFLNWDNASGGYTVTFGPDYQRGLSPSPRGASKIAFNGQGCGVLFGGDGLAETDDPNFFDIQVLNDAWQICRTESGYAWTRLEPPAPLPTIRRGPIIYDEAFDRYVVVGGQTNAGSLFAFEDVWFLEPGATPQQWAWRALLPLPSTFPGRYSHLVYYDPELQAVATGLGFVTPFAQRGEWWLYQNGQLIQAGTIPTALNERQGFGYDYDRARKQLVLWGDNNTIIDEQVWLLTGTATNSPSGWRGLSLDAPVPRAWPTVVYDAARESTVVFGGRRFDDRFVPPDIYTLITPPSFPYLLARIDLDAPRPAGLDRLELRVVATGSGDADGTGPAQASGDGVRVLLWDHPAQVWEEVASGPSGTPLTAEVPAPDRFVSSDGVVPVAISTAHPGTDATAGVLQVNQIIGQLRLRPL